MYRAHMTACAWSLYTVRPSRVDRVHPLSVLSHAVRLSARSAIAYLMGRSPFGGWWGRVEPGRLVAPVRTPPDAGSARQGRLAACAILDALISRLVSRPRAASPLLPPRRGWPAQWPASGAALPLTVGGAGCWEAGPDKRPGDRPAIGAPGFSRVVEPGTACAVAGRGGTATDCTAGRTGSVGRRRPDSRRPAHPLTLSAGAPRPARRRRNSLPCAPPAPLGANCA